MIASNERGFTLIESVLVILLVFILAGVFALSLSGLATARLDNAVNKVAGDLRYAQQMAIGTQNRNGMTILSTTSYNIHVDNSGTDNNLQDPTNLSQPFVVTFASYQQGQLAGVQFSSTTPFCGGSVIEFNSLGAPTDTNGTLLACNSSLTLNYSGNTHTITIQQNTGNLIY